jgi:two-component sensor histidine kinase
LRAFYINNLAASLDDCGTGSQGPSWRFMESLLRLLPGPQPVIVRYAITALIVLVAFALRFALEERTGPYGFILFIPAVMAASLLFDRGTGFFALALSMASVAAIIPWKPPIGSASAAFSSFAIVGTALVFVSEGLHRALERAYTAERGAGLRLEEMSHRVKNKFAMTLSIIGLQARQSEPATRAALDAIAARVRVIANVHDYLQLARHDQLVDMSEYLSELCRSLEDTVRELRPLTVSVKAEPIMLAPDKALPVGLIVNELLTNAFKYAFTDNRIGHVQVELGRKEGALELSVADDGAGCSEAKRTGLGTKLVMLLVDQLGGTAEWKQANPGCKVTATFPAPK